MDKASVKIVIFGGNGFVGTHTAHALQQQGAEVVCISRSGHKPVHLKTEEWSCDVRWCKGDAAEPNTDLLKEVDVVICTVGSPPLPTFSEDAFNQQYFMNGTTCINAIEAANEAGVKKVILLGAKVPWPMRSEKFAYYKGKQDALAAAQAFAQTSPEHSAVVLQPGMITGQRVLDSGRTIRLDLLTAPFSAILPSQFNSVSSVATCVAKHALDSEAQGFTLLSSKEIGTG